jgi:prepilin-type N-terminal cleavage/methylation domain-containing protein
MPIPFPPVTPASPRPSSTRCAGSAFTLIELLVVISIISLLVAILLPALEKARTMSRSASAVLSARQVMLAMHMYANDNKEMIPWASTDPLDGQGDPNDFTLSAAGVFTGGSNGIANDRQIWTGRLLFQGYLQSRADFFSPSHFPGTDLRYTGFGINVWGAAPLLANRDQDIDDRWNILRNEPMRLDGYYGGGGDPSNYRPSEHLIVADAVFNFSYTSPSTYGTRTGTFIIHQGKPNTSLMTYNKACASAFLDGHARAVPEAVLGWRSNPNSDRSGTWLWPATFQSEEAARAPWFLRYNRFYNPRN